ncbi:MAG: hypothetical protein WC730_00685 [Patescibacteria group bacterium]|jgi:hypothetical protein
MKVVGPVLVFFCLIGLLGSTIAHAEMTSTNYIIRFDDISFGGGNTGSSASYQLRDTASTSSLLSSSSATYELTPGFRAGIYDRVADFIVYIQDRSSEVAATTLSSNTVTVTSASGFSVDDMMAIVQDSGESQISAIGKIILIAGNDITVDAWTNSGVAPVIDGSTDYAYVLDASSVSFGTLSNMSTATGIIAWEVSVEDDHGYSVYVTEDGELRDAGALYTIPDVADGTVSTGASEYGARSSDTTLSASTFDTADTGITLSPQQVSSRSAMSFSSRDFLTLKVGVETAQASANYSQSLSFLYVGDY